MLLPPLGALRGNWHKHFHSRFYFSFASNWRPSFKNRENILPSMSSHWQLITLLFFSKLNLVSTVLWCLNVVWISLTSARHRYVPTVPSLHGFVSDLQLIILKCLVRQQWSFWKFQYMTSSQVAKNQSAVWNHMTRFGSLASSSRRYLMVRRENADLIIKQQYLYQLSFSLKPTQCMWNICMLL